MTDTRWLDADEQRAWRRYLRMQAELTARLARQLQTDSDLSMADFEVLVNLTAQWPPFFGRFKRLVEIVSADDEEVLAKLKYFFETYL